MSNQVSLEIDDRTEDAIEQLKRAFNVKSRSAAIRKAIALARAASDAADENQVLTLVKDGKERSILLSA